MAGATSEKKHLSDGELSDDDGEKEENLDTSICRTCNITFTNSRVSCILLYEMDYIM